MIVNVKSGVREGIDRARGALVDLSHRIHCDPDQNQKRSSAEIEVEPEAFRHPVEVVVGEEVVQGGTDHGDGRDLQAGL